MNIKFLINKGDGERKIFFRYRPNRNVDIKKATPYSIDNKLWDEKVGTIKLTARKRNPRTKEEQSFNNKIDTVSVGLSNFKTQLETFIFSNKGIVSADSVDKFLVENGYSQPKITAPKSVIPDTIAGFFKYYIDELENDNANIYKKVGIKTMQKYKSIQRELATEFPRLKIEEVDNIFRKKYTSYRQVAISTSTKELRIIKQFALIAKTLKKPINDEVLMWKFFNEKLPYKYPIITPEEMDRIKALNLEKENLIVARDWLIVGWNIGLRVSDLLKLSADKIKEDKVVYYIQQKTQKPSAAILYGDTLDIIKKYGGNFPRKMSAQRFNVHIKTVCQLAEMNKIIQGGKKVNNRRKIDFYPKYELITSHCCRRSFVSNNIGKLGRVAVQFNSGHIDENMLNVYDQRDLKQTATDILQMIEGN